MSSPPVTIGLIGGSGLGALLDGFDGVPRYVNTPFGAPSGAIVETRIDGVRVLALARHGNGHRLSPSAVPYRANVFALKVLGATHVVATGAVGSLREEYRPRDVVVPDQAIDRTFARASTFFERSAVHVEFADPFCPVLRQTLRDAADDLNRARAEADRVAVHHGGCYVAMEGPAFSTRAESLMHRLWGGDLIGMTALPEARLAREAELPYALVNLVTDYDAWRPAPVAEKGPTPDAGPLPAKGKHELLEEIVSNLRVASENAMALVRAAIARVARDPATLADCPARDALQLAIWSDKARIDAGEIEKLRPLWGRYFPGR